MDDIKVNPDGRIQVVVNKWVVAGFVIILLAAVFLLFSAIEAAFTALENEFTGLEYSEIWLSDNGTITVYPTAKLDRDNTNRYILYKDNGSIYRVDLGNARFNNYHKIETEDNRTMVYIIRPVN